MPSSRSLNAYSDVKLVLDKAVADGGFSFRLPKPSRATTFKSRIYNWLRIWRNHERERIGNLPAGQVPPSPYDDIVARIDPKDPCVIHLTIRQADFLAEITTPEGGPVELSYDHTKNSAAAPFDDLEDTVRQLARNAGLDLD